MLKPKVSQVGWTIPCVTIPGFGTFGTTYRKARKGRHPKTQKEIKIGGTTYAVSFRPGKNLKEAIGGK